MKWEKLNKRSLEKLKIDDNRILVCDTNAHEEFKYDVLQYLDLSNIPELDKTHSWANLLNKENKYDYDDNDVLSLFNYYCQLYLPGKINVD